MKLLEDCENLLKGNQEELKDGLGDSFVTLIILSKQLGFTPSECLGPKPGMK